jgi:tetratricopeptide (TPR) repeat protein
MPGVSPCPQEEDLQRFLLGAIADEEAAPLEQHLTQCEPCFQKALALGGEDTLVETLRTVPRRSVAPSALMDALIQRMSALPPLAGEETGTATSSLPDALRRSAAGSQELYDFLTPPQEAGELGWLGPYRILKVLGSGGMGVVFQAEDTRLGRAVALKVLLDSRYHNARYLARFQGEARAVAQLQHPNIVQLYEVGTHRGRPYFALEYVPGGTLAEYVAGQPQPIADSAALVATIARAIHHAHQQGIVHRDLKPANILLASGGSCSPLSSQGRGVGADDLHRFLENKPIQARPVLAWERVWRWARRRPAAAGLIVLSGPAVVALVVGLWWHTTKLGAQVQRAQAGEQKARQQQHRTDTNYQQARQAIKQMLDRLARFHAAGVPRVEDLRRGLRQDALAFFEDIAKAEADPDPATRLDVAQAYLFMGVLLTQQGEVEAAREKLDRARLLLDKLIAEEPVNGDYQAELGNCLDRLANSADKDDCLRLREQALAIRQALCRAQPDSAAWQRALAASHTNVGVSHYNARRLAQAESHWQAAVRTREQLARDHPEEAADQYGLAVSYSNLALLYRETDRIPAAETLYRKGETLLTPLVEGHPEEKSWASALVRTLRNWGGLLLVTGREEQARLHLTHALKVMDRWYSEDPLSPLVQELLLDCLVARMNSNTFLHRQEESGKDWQRALDLAARRNAWGDLCTGAALEARFGAHALAAARAEYLARQPGIKGENLYVLVKAYALAAQAARKDRQLSTTEQGLKAERCAAEAVQLLDRVRVVGFFKDRAQVEKLKTDADPELLRPRQDYQKMLARLASGG